MTRMFALVAALFMTALAVSSACVANTVGPLQFTLEQRRGPEGLQIRFVRNRDGGQHIWDTSISVASLTGLDAAAFAAPGTRPISFSLVRDAGHVDCSGTGGNSLARGTCTVTANPDFNRFLASRGIAAPTEEESFGLISLGVRRELVGALAQARYPTPTVEQLMELTALDVTPAYIQGLAAHGYRPKTLDTLEQFAALDITPEYIGSFVRAGYGDIPADDLLELKALDISADYVRSFESLGYGRLPVDTLVQLKALDITPAFVRAVQQGDSLPSPDRLVLLRSLGSEGSRR